ncbi:hypothetical protein BDV38DRAFT_293598 [Aspergillus pseudotamarii]|uniref:Uncharacterized protein n=1 Tax=Aspergillus pseudotamarii TaxID=132259 RepID=A0A5N6ST55_ASPPS|nr:uncharacterized protein BDV38DRAFT_293598 [Aspergillus pseudotamarii]KAE8137067.1 hypothetical protein BDV38DRAFT_293598 [Aspergillus pseudotamarii]
MTATLNGMYNTAPDTPSPVYPDRLIRPLPKRTLRSRLSSETAESILYPPAPPATQLFYGTCTDNGEAVNESKVYVQQCDGPEQTPERDHHHPYETGFDAESGDEDGPVVVRRSAGFRESSPSPTMPLGYSGNGARTQIKSSSAGPDGYDAFENTNNKKKRKIPTPGTLAGHHSTLSPEFSSMGLASSAPTSGEGSHVSWAQVRTSGRRDGVSSSPVDTTAKSDQGIISAAIANAAASAFSSPPRGSGNVSMLEQQTTTPTKTQFTFTCESDSSKGMALQAQSPYPAHRSPSSLPPAAQNQRGFSTQGTQTSPHAISQIDQQGQLSHRAPGAEPTAVGKKKKRSPGSIYALAARQRKIQQQYANLHHPPSMEDIWICEFCEYESIFGRPPEALIRQYEIKDRKERKRLAEKKRLLEKAKMKGRKNKKATKNVTKNAAAQPAAYDLGYDRASVDHSSMGGAGLHDDDYIANEDDEESVSASSPAPPATPTCFKTPLPPGNRATAMAGAKTATDGGTTRPP